VEYRLHSQPQFLVLMGYFLLLFVSPILGVVALVTDVVEFPWGFVPWHTPISRKSSFQQGLLRTLYAANLLHK